MSSSEPPPFGALLLRQRAAARLTQEQLAARAGLSPNAVAALERGRRHAPRNATLALLADALALDESARAQFVAAARGEHGTHERSPARVGAADGPTREAVPEVRSRLRWRVAVFEPTPLVDRSQERDAIVRRLTVEGVRLLTLTGPAGVGKTRLALAAAADSQLAGRFPNGVTLVDLAPIRAPQDVLPTIAQALRLTDDGHLPLSERLRTFLRESERLLAFLCEREAVLLVLDNFEQVLPAAAQLADLLAACPSLALLVTSRVPLQLRWEQTLRIAPLPVPDPHATLPPLDALLAVPSVALFVGRARARRADFALGEKHVPLLAQLMVELDGLPLALELAAARLDVLSLPTLARRLGDRLQVLASEAADRPERQRSLEAAMGWSYDLLSERERLLFRCLGVFVGRVTLDAIAAVARAVSGVRKVSEAGAGGAAVGNGEAQKAQEPREEWKAGRTLHWLLSLAEKSLILPLPVSTRHAEPGGGGLNGHHGQDGGPTDAEEDEDSEPAFGMLETVREYARELLTAQGELAAAHRAHAYYFLALAEQAAPLLRGRDQRAWFLRLEREQDNLRAALRWLFDQGDQDGPDAATDQEAALRLTAALGWFWAIRGYPAEGWRWLEEALAHTPQGEADPASFTSALLAAGPLLRMQGDVARARAVLEEGLALAERRQDSAAIALGHTYLGLCSVFAGEMAEAARRLQEALRRWEDLGDLQGRGVTLYYLGLAADTAGDATAAAMHYTASLQLLGAAGDTQLKGFVHCYLGVSEGKRGELSRAAKEVQAGLQTSVSLQDRWLLTVAAQAALAVLGERAALAARARLLGATDALAQATGVAFAWERLPGGQEVVGLRERLAQEEGEWDAAYREGRALTFGEVAALALGLLEEVTQPLRDQKAAPASAQQAEQQLVQHAEPSRVSEREREVLRLVARGRSSKAIGRQLFLSPSTVNHHLNSIFNKLGVSTRAQAVSVAAQRGLL